MGTVNVTTAKKKYLGFFWEIEVRATLNSGSGESVDPMSPTADILDSAGNNIQQCMLTNQSGNTWLSSAHSVWAEPAHAKVRARFLSAEVPDTLAFVETAFAPPKKTTEAAKSKSKKKKAGAAKKPPQ